MSRFSNDEREALLSWPGDDHYASTKQRHPSGTGSGGRLEPLDTEKEDYGSTAVPMTERSKMRASYRTPEAGEYPDPNFKAGEGNYDRRALFRPSRHIHRTTIHAYARH